MLDYTLYLVTDRSLSRERPHSQIVESAIKGGVTCVQYRDKEISDGDFLNEAITLKSVLSHYGVPLIINDRVEIAHKIGAAGLHIGQSDMSLREARNIVGQQMIIGVSAENIDDAIKAEQEGADYIGISPVFLTSTKKDICTPLGLDGVSTIRKKVKIPLVGIGGISTKNAADVIHAGADGVAVVSAIVAAESPEVASRQLLEIVQRAVLS